MRPLTPAELRLLLERGVEALGDWKPDVIVESLALEVSERRLAEQVTEPVAARHRIRPRYRDDLNPKAPNVQRALGFLDAANMVDEMYARASTHPCLLGDCILGKRNLLRPGCRIRRNPYVTRAAEAGIGEGGK